MIAHLVYSVKIRSGRHSVQSRIRSSLRLVKYDLISFILYTSINVNDTDLAPTDERKALIGQQCQAGVAGCC